MTLYKRGARTVALSRTQADLDYLQKEVCLQTDEWSQDQQLLVFNAQPTGTVISGRQDQQTELPSHGMPTIMFVCLLVGRLTSQRHACVSQGWISSENGTCWHTVMKVADQTFYLTQSRYTDTRQPVLALTLAKRNFQRDLTDTNMITDSDLFWVGILHTFRTSDVLLTEVPARKCTPKIYTRHTISDT